MEEQQLYSELFTLSSRIVGLASSQSTGGLWMVRLPAEKAVVDWGCATQVCELPSVSCEEEQSEGEC